MSDGVRARSRTSAMLTLSEIKIVQAEVTQVRGDKVLQERLAALVAKENFVADQDIGGAELASGNL